MTELQQLIRGITLKGAYINFATYADGRPYISVGYAKKKIYFQIQLKDRSYEDVVGEAVLLLHEELEKKNVLHHKNEE